MRAGSGSLVELALSDNPLGNEVAVNLAAVLSQVRNPSSSQALTSPKPLPLPPSPSLTAPRLPSLWATSCS